MGYHMLRTLAGSVPMPKAMLFAAVLFAAAAGVMLAGSQPAAAAPPVQFLAADQADICNTKANGKNGFFGLKPWYYYMDKELGEPFGSKGSKAPADPCGVRCFNIFEQANPNACGQKKSDLPGIGLVIIDNLLRVGGLVAVAFVIIGSFQYVASRGNSERTSSAQSTIISALTGLAITLVAVALVSFLGNRLS